MRLTKLDKDMLVALETISEPKFFTAEDAAEHTGGAVSKVENRLLRLVELGKVRVCAQSEPVDDEFTRFHYEMLEDES